MPSLIECGHGVLTWAMILFLVRSCCAHADDPWDIAGHHHKAGVSSLRVCTSIPDSPFADENAVCWQWSTVSKISWRTGEVITLRLTLLHLNIYYLANNNYN